MVCYSSLLRKHNNKMLINFISSLLRKQGKWFLCLHSIHAWLEMSASCRGFFPPKTTDMPTCRRCVADTTQTMSATLPSVGSSDAVFVSCRHDNLPTCRQETTKSTIVRYDIMQQSMKSQKRPPPWQSRTPSLAAWLL